MECCVCIEAILTTGDRASNNLYKPLANVQEKQIKIKQGNS